MASVEDRLDSLYSRKKKLEDIAKKIVSSCLEYLRILNKKCSEKDRNFVDFVASSRSCNFYFDSKVFFNLFWIKKIECIERHEAYFWPEGIMFSDESGRVFEIRLKNQNIRQFFLDNGETALKDGFVNIFCGDDKALQVLSDFFSYLNDGGLNNEKENA